MSYSNRVQVYLIVVLLALTLVVAPSMAEGVEYMFRPNLSDFPTLDGWRQFGHGTWTLATGEYGGAFAHQANESIIYYEDYSLPLTFRASVTVEGSSWWKGLVFYIDPYEIFVVRFKYGEFSSTNVQCNIYRVEDGELVLTRYSGGVLPREIGPGEKIELVVERHLFKVDVTVNGVKPTGFTPLLMSLPAGARVGFYNISSENDEALFYDLKISEL